jgi:DNA repair exonuclease SbcCD ATPase subunit
MNDEFDKVRKTHM